MLFSRVVYQAGISKIVITLFILSNSIFAGNTGKIFGKVTDEQTNEPLAGVNVVIKSTGQGASTDIEGEFYLIGVQPGKYDIMISYIGYASMNIKDSAKKFNKRSYYLPDSVDRKHFKYIKNDLTM